MLTALTYIALNLYNLWWTNFGLASTLETLFLTLQAKIRRVLYFCAKMYWISLYLDCLYFKDTT